MLRRPTNFFPCLMLVLFPHAFYAGAGDVAPVGAPKINGVEIVETRGEMTGLNVKDPTILTEADFRQIRKLEGLKSLSFGLGLDDNGLKILAGLPALETFTSNGMKLTDEGAANFATFPMLRNLTFFHPGKEFEGSGLAALATLAQLEGLTVAGSAAFTDPGMAAIATLPHLKSIRTWHTGITREGIKMLGGLKELKSLTVGQRLAMQAPAALDDETVAALAEFSSLEALTLQTARLSLPALLKLKQLPNLKNLTLDNIEINEADIATLKQELPAVEIKWTAPSGNAVKRIEGIFGPTN